MIEACNIFWWAKFRNKKDGIKVHTLYDVETQIPVFFHITDAFIQDYINIPSDFGAAIGRYANRIGMVPSHWTE